MTQRRPRPTLFPYTTLFRSNAAESGATKVEFGIEWQAVEKEAVYRRIIADNGSGMTRDELLRFFSTLGEGAKRIGDRKSTRLNSSHVRISYAVFCLKKKKKT